MTALFKLSLQTMAIATILITATAYDDASAAPAPILPPVRLEVGMVRVQHQKMVIKVEIVDCLSARWVTTVQPHVSDVFLKRLFRADGGICVEPPLCPIDPATSDQTQADAAKIRTGFYPAPVMSGAAGGPRIASRLRNNKKS